MSERRQDERLDLRGDATMLGSKSAMNASGYQLTRSQIEAVNRIFPKLKDWSRSEETLEWLSSIVPAFDGPSTLVKTITVNALMGTQIYALTAMASHVASIVEKRDLTQAGPELIDEIGNFTHGEKKRNCISFASKFAHFFIDSSRFPIKDDYATRMVKFHLQGVGHVSGGTYAAFFSNVDALKKNYELVAISYRELDHYLWFSGKYREGTRKPPFEKRGRRREGRKESKDAQSKEKRLQRFLREVAAADCANDLKIVLGES